MKNAITIILPLCIFLAGCVAPVKKDSMSSCEGAKKAQANLTAAHRKPAPACESYRKCFARLRTSVAEKCRADFNSDIEVSMRHHINKYVLSVAVDRDKGIPAEDIRGCRSYIHLKMREPIKACNDQHRGKCMGVQEARRVEMDKVAAAARRVCSGG